VAINIAIINDHNGLAMKIKSFFDNETATVTYIVSDEKTKKCAVIDSVLNYDQYSGKTSTKSADQVIKYIKSNKLKLEFILETHIHADHITAASYIKEKLGGKIAIGDKIRKVLKFWVPLFNIGKDTKLDGSQFDILFKNKDKFNIGSLRGQVIHTPGHTPACASYHIENAVFTGDSIFMPYVGTGRTDFPGGDAKTLYRSIKKILLLPDDTRIFVCHDYPPAGQKPAWETTVAEQKIKNILVNKKITEKQYVKLRNERDNGKSVPKMLIPSIQVNLRAGKFGKKESNGVQYIKVPVDKI